MIAALGALLLLAPMTQTFAQEKLVKEVERMAKKDGSNLNEARKILQPALEHPETKDKAKTWYVAGLVEETDVERSYLQLQLGQKVNEQSFYNALDKMVDYYVKAYELDEKAEGRKNKLKRREREGIEGAISTYYGFLVNAGSLYLENENFERAHYFFKRFGDVKKLPMFADSPVAVEDSMSMQIAFFSAYTASQMENNLQNAIAEYEAIKNVPYRQNDVYQLLAQSYVMAEDTVNFLNTLQEGAELFPEEQFYLYNMINVYIRQGRNDEAKAYLDKAIVANPNNEQLYFVLATVHEQGFKDAEGAEANYRKALEINPEYGDAIIGLGRIYYNEAVMIRSAANAITDTAEYEKENAKANELFKQALPYFERAVEIQPESNEYMMALRGIYYNLGMDEKVAEIEKRMGL